MIANLLKNWHTCHYPAAFGKAFKFLESVHTDTPDGRYPILGSDIYAMVQSGTTSAALPEKLELHRKYIDIQYLFEGRERLAWSIADNLEILTPYNPEKDFEFVRVPEALSTFEMTPGMFAVFCPWDAHYGCLAFKGEVTPFRKVVVKVALEMIES